MTRVRTFVALVISALLVTAGVASTPAAAVDDQNMALSGQPSASFTAGHNNLFAINDGVHSNSGAPETSYWGTWTPERPASQHLQYSWAEPVSIDKSVISFWTDAAPGTGANVTVPQSWVIEYWDESNTSWKPVANPSGYGTSRAGTNVTTFDRVETTRLRATFQAYPNPAGTSYSALGVSEWEAWGAPAESPVTTVVDVPAVHTRTQPGVVPDLPAQLRVIRLNGAVDQVAVQWDAVDPADLVDGAKVKVAGQLEGITESASATIWVRSAASSQVDRVDDTSVITMKARRPAMPSTVTVTYDDGLMDSAVPVTWPTIPEGEYATEGSFEIEGVVDGTDLKATAYVFVEPSDGTTEQSSFALGLSPGGPDGANGWYRSPVVVGITPHSGEFSTYDAMINLNAWAMVDRTFEVSADGEYVIAVREQGASAEVDPEFVDFRIDRTQPVSKAAFDTAARTVTLSAADGTSGVDRIEYRRAGDWTTYDAPISVGEDAEDIAFRAVDVAGNVEETNTVSAPASGVQLKLSVTGAVLTRTTTAYGQQAEVQVRVNGLGGAPTGKVVVSADGNRLADAELFGGRATVRLPRTVPVGVHELTVAYAGDEVFMASSDSVTLTVVKATPSVRASVRPTTLTKSQRATARWAVSAPGALVTGTVRVTIHRGSTLVRTRSLSVATRSWTLPAFRRTGTYTVRFSYLGSTTIKPGSAKVTVKVK